MRFFIVFTLFLAFAGQTAAQTAPRFILTPISNSGCSLYLPGIADPVNVSYAPDSSIVYTIETVDSSSGQYYRFGAIVVHMNGIVLDGNEEDMLEWYMDYLREEFGVIETMGYERDHILPTHPTARGVIDYWDDATGDQWVVKGWAAESTLFVMFVYGPPVEAYPNNTIVDTFFKGARFKGDR